MLIAHEPKTARTAAFRLLPAPLRSSALKRPKGHGPTRRLMGSLLVLRTMLTAHEPKTARTAAFRLLPAPLRSSALKRPKGHGPGDGSWEGRAGFLRRMLQPKWRLALRGLAFALALAWPAMIAGDSWTRHTIDASSRGADGVRVADVNRDGWSDVVTGWEEGGKVRVYLHPGQPKVRLPWPAVTVGTVSSPEDAVFADLDGDGATDVVSSCEGTNRTVFIHWAPRGRLDYLEARLWTTEPFPSFPAGDLLSGHAPIIRDIGGPDGAKFDRMELIDLDRDGDLDVLTTEETENLGVIWYENPQRR